MSKYKKRNDGRYETTIYIGTDPNTGKPQVRHIYASTIADLELRKADMLSALDKGIYADDKHITVRTWANKWLSLYKSDKEVSTYNGYANIIKNHITDIADIRLRDLKASDVQLCINKQTGHQDIQRRIKMTMTQILDAAIDDGLLYRNVASKTKVPNRPGPSTRALTPQEKKAIKKCSFDPMEECFLYMLWYTGMRPEEARGLMRQDIDLQRQVIHIERAAAFQNNGTAYLKDPKTESGTRTIDILSPLQPILEDYLSGLNNLYLFHSEGGNLMCRSTYKRFWDRIRNKINTAMGGTAAIRATDITPYVFRHEYATLLYYSGIDQKEAARLMGHADIRMILEVYAHLDKNKSQAKSKLEEYLNGTY